MWLMLIGEEEQVADRAANRRAVALHQRVDVVHRDQCAFGDQPGVGNRLGEIASASAR